MARPPISATSWATAMLDTVARPMWLSGMRNAEAMRLVSPFGRLSRGVAGIVGDAIVCNTPGSPKGCVEQLGAILDVLPHALALLHEAPTSH